ncbi:hypothetical protein FMM05_18155 [Flavobacterium zepuense]|uniref:Uncharacterized protein n=1 Tax=Flavobacterium zepuense TaxID=2593302 RepID=A0A552UW44_9FLAO|nr:hypothetical protein [Flavobacterium zepuense]TRW22427.1 hypothetical protein FMM05_18155 [Flavobacterium zepuense]
MKTEALKISVAQRVLNLSDDGLLKKISRLLDEENIVGFDTDGNPITNKDFVQDINSALLQLKEENMETYSSDEVKRRILGQ